MYSPTTITTANTRTVSTTIRDLQVHEPCGAWLRMEPHWGLIENLLGGTLQMQAAGRKFLPQEPKESDDSYRARLQRSICPPYLSRLEAMLAGMLTRKPVRIDNAPDPIGEHLFDIDLLGNTLDVFLQNLARLCLRYGHCGLLVDFPRGDEGDNTPSTGNRPYWCVYDPRSILGWRTDVVNGTQKLTQLRLLEEVSIPYGPYGEEVVQQVRVLTPGAYQLYRKQASKNQDWELIAEGKTTLKEIPFAVCYSNRVGLLESTPPLEEVAHLNLQAYRVGSDLANQLHLSAVPRLHIFGAPADLDEIEAGPESAIALPVDSRVEFLEPQGRSFSAQFDLLNKIEKQIRELGLAAVVGQKMVAETAAAKEIERSQGDAALMALALSLQDTIDTALQFHAQFLGLGSGGSCTVNRDFLGQRLEPAAVQQFLQLRINGEITQETLLQQLSAGGWLAGDFDVLGELEATASQQQQRLDAQASQLDMALGAFAARPDAAASGTDPQGEDA